MMLFGCAVVPAVAVVVAMAMAVAVVPAMAGAVVMTVPMADAMAMADAVAVSLAMAMANAMAETQAVVMAMAVGTLPPRARLCELTWLSPWLWPRTWSWPRAWPWPCSPLLLVDPIFVRFYTDATANVISAVFALELFLLVAPLAVFCTIEARRLGLHFLWYVQVAGYLARTHSKYTK